MTALCTPQAVNEVDPFDGQVTPNPQLPLFCWLFGCGRAEEHTHGIWTAP